MTKTELNLYIELQDVFAPFMGEWQVGDRYLCPILYGINGKIGVVYQEDRGSGDIISPGIPDEDLIRLPLPIDPVNPERGCWNMISKERRNRAGFLNKLSLSDNPTLVILQELRDQEKSGS